MQTKLWSLIKKACPFFIQGMTKEEMEARVKSKTKAGWKSVSIDGSGFDSTQNAKCMDAVDKKFWNKIRPIMLHMLQKCQISLPNAMKVDISWLCDKLIHQATDNKSYCFTFLPEIE